MKKILLILLLFITIFSCKKENIIIKKDVTFTINVKSFITGSKFKNTKVDYLFEHKYGAAKLEFEEISTGIIYSITMPSLDSFKITLPEGEYMLSGSDINKDTIIDNYSYYYGDLMKYDIISQHIVLNNAITSLDVTLTPSCSLFIIEDIDKLLTNQYLLLYSYNGSYSYHGINIPLHLENGLLFIYFEITTERINKLYLTKQKYNFELSVENLQYAYIYFISITNNEGNYGVKINNNFLNAQDIIW